MRHHPYSIVLTAAATLAFSFPTLAQNPTPPPPNVAPSAFLSDAVAKAAIPRGVLALAIDPKRQSLPGAIPTASGDSLSQIAAAFGLMNIEYGQVTALAVPTMTVFNDTPGGAQVYADMPPRQIIVLLAASLSRDQWDLLTGKGGIADTDLSTDEQHAMWAALWRNRTVFHQVGVTGTQIPHDDVVRSHLRLSTSVSLRLQSKTENSESLSTNDIARRLPAMWEQAYLGAGNEKGAGPDTPRQEVPNVLKAGDLDLSDDRLRTTVDVSGAKTIDELVDRIRLQTGIEIYADRRMGVWPLVLAGDTTPKPASSLLRALALTVTGAYRRVGPAYVLAADMMGAGARAQLWRDFERDVEKLREKPVSEASTKINHEHSDSDLPSYDNDLALSAEQIKDHLPIENLSYLQIPFDHLTPAQKAAARKLAVDVAREQSSPGHPYEVDLTKDVTVENNPVVSILTPGDAKPLVLAEFSPSRYNLFRRGDADMMEEMHKMLLKQKADEDSKRDPDANIHLKPLLLQIKRRALLAAPRSEQEATEILHSMAAVGFNELWIKVFREGNEQRDLLKATTKAAAQNGIAVYPVMSLFDWGQSAPEEARDITIQGEDSLQSNTHWRTRNAADLVLFQQVKKMRDDLALNFPIPDFGYSELIVSPYSDTVKTKLSDAVRDIAATPGVGGIVWTDTLPPGYDNAPRKFDEEFFAPLGYTLPARLAFLRKYHVDPIDIIFEQSQAPAWPSWMQSSMDDIADLPTKWRSFSFDVNLTLLKTLYDAAQTKGRPLTVLIPQRRDYGLDDPNSHWFGSWNPASAPPPSLMRSDIPYTGAPPPPPAAQAASQSQTTLIAFTAQWQLDSAKLISLLGGAVKDIAAGKSSWQGFVLDVTKLSGDPLDKAAAEVAPK